MLAVQEDEDTGYSEGLGCTVVDPVSGSVVSATIGGRMRDPGSGETVPITGVYREPTTYQVLLLLLYHGYCFQKVFEP